MLLKILSWSLVKRWTPGDEVIICNGDHEANAGPWADLERQLRPTTTSYEEFSPFEWLKTQNHLNRRDGL